MKKSKKITNINFVLNTEDIENFRYKSVDDWFDPMIYKDWMQFKTYTADMKNIDYNFLVLLHAMIEQFLCYRKGITDKQVTDYDVAHDHCTDPGGHEEAPYHAEHEVAMRVEEIVAMSLGIDWGAYEEKMDKVLAKWKKKT